MDERMSIVIVDDEGIVRKSFLHWFEKFGYPVYAVASGLHEIRLLHL